MKSINHTLIAGTVLTMAIAVAGCDASMYTQANETLKTVQTAGKAVGNARLPTAAIAASLGGLKMMEALSLDGQEAKSSGIIAAGGGNIIAAGGGNIIAAGGGNYFLNAFEPDKKITKPVTGEGIDGSVTYMSKVNASRVESEIEDFTCKSQGYEIKAKGSFVYDAKVTLTDEFAGSTGKGEMVCQMSGSVTHKDTVITLKGLTFRTFDPMPEKAKTIGGFTLEVEDGGKKHQLAVNIGTENGKIVAEADSLIDGKSTGEKVKFDQENAGGTPIGAAAGAAGTGVDAANAADKK